MDKGRPVSARITEPEIAAIDRFAEYAGVSRSEMVRRLLAVAISQASRDDRPPNQVTDVVLLDRSAYQEVITAFERTLARNRRLLAARQKIYKALRETLDVPEETPDD